MGRVTRLLELEGTSVGWSWNWSREHTVGLADSGTQEHMHARICKHSSVMVFQYRIIQRENWFSTHLLRDEERIMAAALFMTEQIVQFQQDGFSGC